VISLLKADERSYLENKIESLRKEMIRIGIQEGLICERTIIISQKLDTYIARYQKMYNHL
jgi:hypothetical protein